MTTYQDNNDTQDELWNGTGVFIPPEEWGEGPHHSTDLQLEWVEYYGIL